MFLGGVPDLLTATLCWMVWQTPGLLGATWVKTMVVVVLMEFFVIHSGGIFAAIHELVATRRNRVLLSLLLIVFYGLFVVALAHGLDENWMYAFFGWLFLSKLLVAWTADRNPKFTFREQMIDWPFAVAAYLGSLFTGFIAFEHSRGGISTQVFADSGLAGAGLVQDQPWAALAAGSFYFSLMALWRMRLWRW